VKLPDHDINVISGSHNAAAIGEGHPIGLTLYQRAHRRRNPICSEPERRRDANCQSLSKYLRVVATESDTKLVRAQINTNEVLALPQTSGTSEKAINC
jgi:hypothetical protein